MGPTVAEIKSKLQAADAAEFAVLERSLVADTRKGVLAAVESGGRGRGGGGPATAGEAGE